MPVPLMVETAAGVGISWRAKQVESSTHLCGDVVGLVALCHHVHAEALLMAVAVRIRDVQVGKLDVTVVIQAEAERLRARLSKHVRVEISLLTSRPRVDQVLQLTVRREALEMPACPLDRRRRIAIRAVDQGIVRQLAAPPESIAIRTAIGFRLLQEAASIGRKRRNLATRAPLSFRRSGTLDEALSVERSEISRPRHVEILDTGWAEAAECSDYLDLRVPKLIGAIPQVEPLAA
jgi:hypothetical protein